MARRTLSSCWKQFNKLSSDYLTEKRPREECLEKLRDLTAKSNNDQIGDQTLAPLFVKPYVVVPLSLVLTSEMGEDGEEPKWQTHFDPETNTISLHPLTCCRFIRDIGELRVTDDDYDDFLHCRYKSFLVEIAKLPSIYLLFMLVLQRVASLLEIAHLEKRGGIVEVAEGESYHTMLWAFKELEAFTRKTYGMNIRAQYGISWYESEWITGR